MLEHTAEPILRVLGFLFKVLSLFLLIRGVLYLAGFRYNIPIVDDFFWAIIGFFASFGTKSY